MVARRAPTQLFHPQIASDALKEQRDAWRCADPPRGLYPETFYTKEEDKRAWYDQHPWYRPADMDLHPFERYHVEAEN